MLALIHLTNMECRVVGLGGEVASDHLGITARPCGVGLAFMAVAP
jgi:hypothetical protein